MKTAKEIHTLAQLEQRNLVRYFNTPDNKPNKYLEKYPLHVRNALYLLTLSNPYKLCVFMKRKPQVLQHLFNNPEYKEYTIPKKKGGERLICEPNKQLKLAQKRLGYFLQAYYLLIKPEEVHGFVVNPHYLGTYCNIAENARPHLGKQKVLNIDLKDFFPSITAQRVQQLFRSFIFNYNEEVATALALLTTYEGRLPIGAPTSPIISNFICLPLDRDLKIYCQEKGLTYTRYADDLTFSSNELITKEDINSINSIIKKNHFEINHKKLRLQSAHQRQTVTGLTVNKILNVDRNLLKHIRAMLFDLNKNGLSAAVKNHYKFSFDPDKKQSDLFVSRLRGYINFVGQIKGKQDPHYIKFKTAFNSCLPIKNTSS